MTKRVLIAVFGILLLSGCGYRAWETVDRGEFQPTTNNPFSLALTKYYTELAKFEGNEMADWSDAVHYSRKALAAADGQDVQPEVLGTRRLAPEFRSELEAARSRLLTALNGNGRTTRPDLAAFAQTRFDCWVEQQEEGHQPDHIAECRDAFFEAMEELEAREEAVIVEEEETVVVTIEPLTVFFNFDRDDLTPIAQLDLREFIAVVQQAGITEFSVTGYTDTAGPADYNLDLSLRRANSVRQYMISQGISANAISVAGRGESDLAVPTADGVREPANRRAVILIQ